MCTSLPPKWTPAELTPPSVPKEEVRYLGAPVIIKLEPYLDGSYTDGQNTFLFEDGGVWYLYYDYPSGGGSGESYWIDDRTEFVKISMEGEFKDLGTLKAAHIVQHVGCFYYVELVGGILSTPGIGKVLRVDMDGENKETIISEPIYGSFRIAYDKICFVSLYDGKAYFTDLDGENKTPVGSHIVPDNHRAWVDYYDDIIISRYWYQNLKRFVKVFFKADIEKASDSGKALSGAFLVSVRK